MDDYMYVQGSSNPGYGVSLPPGRDYGTSKALRGTSIDADYPSTIPVRGAPRIDDRNDNRAAYPRELERREKDHRRDYLQEREKDREREKERERERERERARERERRARQRERLNAQREKDRERDRKIEIKTKLERTPARISRERTGPLVTKEGRSVRRESPHREALHRWSCLTSTLVCILSCYILQPTTNAVLCHTEGGIHLLRKKEESTFAR